MTVCRIDYDTVNLCLYKGFHTLHNVCRNTDSGAAEQSSLCIMGR